MITNDSRKTFQSSEAKEEEEEAMLDKGDGKPFFFEESYAHKVLLEHLESPYSNHGDPKMLLRYKRLANNELYARHGVQLFEDLELNRDEFEDEAEFAMIVAQALNHEDEGENKRHAERWTDYAHKKIVLTGFDEQRFRLKVEFSLRVLRACDRKDRESLVAVDEALMHLQQESYGYIFPLGYAALEVLRSCYYRAEKTQTLEAVDSLVNRTTTNKTPTFDRETCVKLLNRLLCLEEVAGFEKLLQHLKVKVVDEGETTDWGMELLQRFSRKALLLYLNTNRIESFVEKLKEFKLMRWDIEKALSFTMMSSLSMRGEIRAVDQIIDYVRDLIQRTPMVRIATTGSEPQSQQPQVLPREFYKLWLISHATNVEKAQAIFAEMRANNVPIDINICDALGVGWVMTKQFNKIVAFLEQIKNESQENKSVMPIDVKECVFYYSSLIMAGSGTSEEMESWAEALWKKKKHRTSFNCKVLLRVWIERQRRDRIEEVLEWMRQYGVRLARNDYSKLLTIWAKISNREQARLRFERGVDEAKYYVDAVDLEFYNVAMLEFVELLDVENVLYLRSRMTKEGIAPDLKTYTILIKLWSFLRDVKRIDEVLQQMMAKDIAPDTVIYNLLIYMWLEMGDLQKAKELITLMQESNVSFDYQSCIQLIHLCSHPIDQISVEQLAEKLDRIKDYMTSNNIEMHPLVYLNLMNVWWKKRRVDKIQELLNEMGDPALPYASSRYKIDPTVLDAIRNVFRANTFVNWETADEVSLVQCALLNEVTMAERVLEQMTAMSAMVMMTASSKLDFGVHACNLAIAIFAKNGRVDSVTKAVELMKSSKIQSNDFTKQCIALLETSSAVST